MNAEDGKTAADAARWFLSRMREEPENMDLLLREILQTSPADQEVRLDRSRGTCLLEGELTSQCAQRYLQLALEAEDAEAADAAGDAGAGERKAYWAACTLSQAKKAGKQFQRLGAEKLEKESMKIAEFAQQLLPPETCLTEMQVMNRSEKNHSSFCRGIPASSTPHSPADLNAPRREQKPASCRFCSADRESSCL